MTLTEQFEGGPLGADVTATNTGFNSVGNLFGTAVFDNAWSRTGQSAYGAGDDRSVFTNYLLPASGSVSQWNRIDVTNEPFPSAADKVSVFAVYPANPFFAAAAMFGFGQVGGSPVLEFRVADQAGGDPQSQTVSTVLTLGATQVVRLEIVWAGLSYTGRVYDEGGGLLWEQSATVPSEAGSAGRLATNLAVRWWSDGGGSAFSADVWTDDLLVATVADVRVLRNYPRDDTYGPGGGVARNYPPARRGRNYGNQP